MDNKIVSALDVRREYYREWRKKNPDKVKQHNANYWAKKARQMTTAESFEIQTEKAADNGSNNK